MVKTQKLMFSSYMRKVLNNIHCSIILRSFFNVKSIIIKWYLFIILIK